jgi:hypothetical protein
VLIQWDSGPCVANVEELKENCSGNWKGTCLSPTKYDNWGMNICIFLWVSGGVVTRPWLCRCDEWKAETDAYEGTWSSYIYKSHRQRYCLCSIN